MGLRPETFWGNGLERSSDERMNLILTRQEISDYLLSEWWKGTLGVGEEWRCVYSQRSYKTVSKFEDC